MPRLRLLRHHHSFQPYALLDEDEWGDRSVVAESRPRTGRAQQEEGVYPPVHSATGKTENDADVLGDPAKRAFPTIYYVGYRCRECGESGYRVP